MNSYFRYFSQNLKWRQKGAVLPLVVICLILFIMFAALAIDLGYLFTGRNELQNAADAAALGATRQLGVIYKIIPPAEQGSYNVDTKNIWDDAYSKDKDTIIDNAIKIAGQNKAASSGISVSSNDVQIGKWNPSSSPTFTQTDDNPNAVRVTARRDDTHTGNIATFFGGIFGTNSFPVSAVATAALTGQSTTDEGELELPIGLDEDWFNGNTDICGDVIQFSPTNSSCAGWTSFKYGIKDEDGMKEGGANDITLRSILLPEDDNKFLSSPASGVGEKFNFIGGDLSAQTFDNLMAKYWEKGVDVDKVYNPSNYDPNNLPIPLKNWDDPTNPPPGTKPPPIPICKNSSSDGIVACTEEGAGPRLTYPCVKEYGCQNQNDITSAYDRNAHEWETYVVVYESSACDNPNKSRKIAGYVKVTVFNVGWPSFKSVQGRVECNRVSNEDTRGGGGYYGVYGSIPNLVE